MPRLKRAKDPAGATKPDPGPVDATGGEFTTVQNLAEGVPPFASFPGNALTGQSPVVSHGRCMQ